MKNIQCLFGKHDWKDHDEYRRECKRCGRKEQWFRVIDMFGFACNRFVKVQEFIEHDYSKLPILCE